MSSVALQGNAGGSGAFVISSPSSNNSRTLTLPDATTTLVGTDATQTLTNKTLTSPTMTTPTIDSAQVPTVSGTAPLYMCRAWAKWSGVTTVTVNGSGNISSITRGSTGTYTVNFTTAISDANYSIGSAIGTGDNNNPYTMNISASPTTSAFTLTVNRPGLVGLYDSSLICIQVFR